MNPRTRFGAARSAAVLFAALAIAACGTAPPSTTPIHPPPFFDAVLREQAKRYALMQPADLYKLVHQAILGPSHLFIGSNSNLESGLNVEIAEIGPAPALEPDEPEVEVLDPQLNLARVNLRPYLQHGGKVENLVRAIAQTAREHRGDRAEFLGALQRAEEMIPELNLGLIDEDDGKQKDRKPKKSKAAKNESDAAADVAEAEPSSAEARSDYQREFHDLVEKMRSQGFPPGDHSTVYGNVYSPAYRIVYLQHVTDRDYGGRVPPRVDEHHGLNPDPWDQAVKKSAATQPASSPAESDDAFEPPADGGGR